VSTARLALHAATWLGMAVVLGVLLLTSCTPECTRQLHGACWYGEALTPETEARIAAVLPLLPADPWPCVETVALGVQHPACPGAAGCFVPAEHSIYTSQAALHHELAHAALECAGLPLDYAHAAPWWREVDR